MMGNKIRAKKRLKRQGFRSCRQHGVVQTSASGPDGGEIGFPVILKRPAEAAAGGMKSPARRSSSRRCPGRSAEALRVRERRHVIDGSSSGPAHRDPDRRRRARHVIQSRRTECSVQRGTRRCWGESLAGAERQAARADGPHPVEAMRKSATQRGDIEFLLDGAAISTSGDEHPHQVEHHGHRERVRAST